LSNICFLTDTISNKCRSVWQYFIFWDWEFHYYQSELENPSTTKVSFQRFTVISKNLLLWNCLAKWIEIWWEAPMEGSVLSFLKAEWAHWASSFHKCIALNVLSCPGNITMIYLSGYRSLKKSLSILLQIFLIQQSFVSSGVQDFRYHLWSF
jgi:hypothetical protein